MVFVPSICSCHRSLKYKATDKLTIPIEGKIKVGKFSYIKVLLLCTVLLEYSSDTQNSIFFCSFFLFQTVGQTPSAGRETSSSVECEPYFGAKWEIPSKNLLLGDVLGEGLFGVVRKGVLKEGGKLRDVAVKMLRGAGRNYCSYCLQSHVKLAAFASDTLS
jgi:hypothetical protein